MKHLNTVPILLFTVLLGAQVPGAISGQDGKPETLVDRISYAYGVVVARDLKERGIPINVEVFLKGFSTITEGNESLMSEAEIGQTFDENRLRMDEENAQGEEKANLMAGKAFLEKNAKKEGVKVTPRGLQYEVIKEGEGPKPELGNSVTVHYKGTMIDGKVFDSSLENGEPITFPLDRVIPGWTEGLQLMPLGSKYRLFIPYHLAYGDSGAGDVIKPFSALIFEVELLEIK